LAKIIPLNHRPKLKRRWPYWVGLVCVAFLISGYFKISAGVVKTMMPQWHLSTEELPVEAIILREEHVIRSPIKGQIRFEDLAEGERVHVGQKIATMESIHTETRFYSTPVTTDWAGIASYTIDGLEGALSNSSLTDYNLKDIKSLKLPVQAEKAFIEKGEAVFRIINPFEDILAIIYFSADSLKNKNLYPAQLKEKALWLNIENAHYQIGIQEVELFENDVFCLAKIIDEARDFFNARKLDCNLVLDQKEGYLVPKTAIVDGDEQPGVYLEQYGEYVWQPIEILLSEDSNCLLKMEQGHSPVIINPEVLD
jgi:putative membrane fusion protein